MKTMMMNNYSDAMVVMVAIKMRGLTMMMMLMMKDDDYNDDTG